MVGWRSHHPRGGFVGHPYMQELAALSRMLGKTTIGLLLGLIVYGSGCAAQSTSSIAQIDPYVGRQPSGIQALPPIQQPREEEPRPSIRGDIFGDKSWTPAGGISNRWKYIVVHHSASDKPSPAGMTDWHVRGRGWDALGYHFVIGNGVKYPDGQIFVGERWTKQMHGAHCKTPGNQYNEHGVGICLIGDLQRHPPTKAQLASLGRLVSFLSSKCNVPKSRILTHGGITGKTECPGRYFSLNTVLPLVHSSPVTASAR